MTGKDTHFSLPIISSGRKEEISAQCMGKYEYFDRSKERGQRFPCPRHEVK